MPRPRLIHLCTKRLIILALIAAAAAIGAVDWYLYSSPPGGRSSYGVPAGARLVLAAERQLYEEGGYDGRSELKATYQSGEEEYAIDRMDSCVLEFRGSGIPSEMEMDCTINIRGYRDGILTVDLWGDYVRGDRRAPYTFLVPASQTVEIRAGAGGGMMRRWTGHSVYLRFRFLLPDDHPAMQRERFWQAAARNDTDALRRMVAAGQDPLLRDERGTPLDWAIYCGAWASARYLCEFAYDTTAAPGFASYPYHLLMPGLGARPTPGPATRRAAVETPMTGYPNQDQELRQTLIGKLAERELDGPPPAARGRSRR